MNRIQSPRKFRMLGGICAAMAIALVSATACAAEIPEREQWVDLFNGEDLEGWYATGGSEWLVEDGILIGRQGEDYAAGDLFTEESFSDFEFLAEYRCVWPANSGIWFRYTDHENAYQADILEFEEPEAYTGSIYAYGRLFIAINDDPAVEDRDGWNTMRIRAVGDHLEVWINGIKTADIHDDHFSEGRFGIQVHPGEEFGDMEIHIREARVKVLE